MWTRNHRVCLFLARPLLAFQVSKALKDCRIELSIRVKVIYKND